MRKFFAVVFSLIFIVLSPLAVYAYSLKVTLLNPTFYKSTLARHGVYERALDAASEQLFSPEGQPLVPFISLEELQSVAKKVITPDWLQLQVEMIIDRAFVWFYSDEDIREVQLAIELTDLKRRAAEQFQEIIRQKYDSLSECTLQDLRELEKRFQDGDLSSLPCRPPGFSVDQLLEQFDINQFLKGVPDQLDLMAVLKGEVALSLGEGGAPLAGQPKMNVEEIFTRLTEARAIAHQVLTGLIVLLVSLGLLFVFTILLVMKSLRSVVRWAGVNLLIPGLILSSSFFVLQRLFNQFLDSKMQGERFPPEVLPVLRSVADGTFTTLTTPVEVAGFVAFGLGFILLVISFIIKKPVKQASARTARPATR